MKRTCIVKPNSNQKPIKASRGIRFNKSAARRLQATLQQAYNELDAMGYDTYKAVDGDNLQEDLDTYIRQIDILVREE